MAAVRERVALLRALTVLLGSAFLIRFVALESLYAPDGGLVARVMTAMMEGLTLGALGYAPNAPATGYVACCTLAMFLVGLVIIGMESGGRGPGLERWAGDALTPSIRARTRSRGQISIFGTGRESPS
jgi:hypothetical protein